jgi:hypothetical protein
MAEPADVDEPVDGDEVAASAWLTQLGHLKIRRSRAWARFGYEFRCCPSVDDDGYVSLLQGRLSVAETVPLIARGDSEGSADCTRYTQAEGLTKAGFRVVHRPLPKLRMHVAVYYDGEWDDTVSTVFDACFTEFMKGELG